MAHMYYWVRVLSIDWYDAHNPQARCWVVTLIEWLVDFIVLFSMIENHGPSWATLKGPGPTKPNRNPLEIGMMSSTWHCTPNQSSITWARLIDAWTRWHWLWWCRWWLKMLVMMAKIPDWSPADVSSSVAPRWQIISNSLRIFHLDCRARISGF